MVAEGTNLVTSSKDPTAHAEVTAIRNACKQLDTFDVTGCVIYTSCEPCPMCLCAIYWARLDQIYYVLNRADAASIGFDDAHMYEEIPKQHSERRIPIEHIPLMKEAIDVFHEWEKKQDRIPY